MDSKPTSGDGLWSYSRSAQFHRDYGRANPYEDWSTAWEAYYQHTQGTLSTADTVRLRAKFNIIDRLFSFLAAN